MGPDHQGKLVMGKLGEMEAIGDGKNRELGGTEMMCQLEKIELSGSKGAAGLFSSALEGSYSQFHTSRKSRQSVESASSYAL